MNPDLALKDSQITPLYGHHKNLGAKMVDFSGWKMPLQYRGISAEHNAVRNNCGIFDVSHMGQLIIRGSGTFDWLLRLFPSRLSNLRSGQMQYTTLCNRLGGCIDDMIIYCLGSNEFLLVVNAARTSADLRWLQDNVDDADKVTILDNSSDSSMLAVQGPASCEVLAPFTSQKIENLDFLSFVQCELAGINVLLSRSGYTGEDGFELIVQSQYVCELWEKICNFDVEPCGLGARDTLRTEMGYPLYGKELSEAVSPLESGLSWTIDWSRVDQFIGGARLKKLRNARSFFRLYGLKVASRGIPRSGYEVIDKENCVIGLVTSGTYSPTLECGIALARLDTKKVDLSISKLFVVDRDRHIPVEIVRLPFIKK